MAQNREQHRAGRHSKDNGDPPKILPKPAFSVAELEQILGVSHAFLYELIKSGELRTFTLGRRRFASLAAVDELIARREKAAA